MSNKAATEFSCIRWEVRIIKFIIDMFEPVKAEERTDVGSNSCEAFKRSAPLKDETCSVVEHKAYE